MLGDMVHDRDAHWNVLRVAEPRTRGHQEEEDLQEKKEEKNN